MGRRAKRNCWILAVFSFLIGLIFYQTVLTSIATWSVRAYVFSKWGQSVRCEQSFWDGDQLVLVQPHFDDGLQFSAKKVLLRFNFKDGALHFEIEIEQPHWHFFNPISLEKNPLISFFQHEGGPWMKIHAAIRAKEGIISWKNENNALLHKLLFDLEFNSYEGGEIKLNFQPLSIDDSFLSLRVVKEEQGVELDCYCENADLSALIAFGHLFGLDSSLFSVSSGSLQGHYKIGFLNSKRPYIEGLMVAKNLDFISINNHLYGHVGAMRFQFEKNSFANVSSEQVPTTIGLFEISNPAKLVYEGPLRKWAIDGIRGNITLDPLDALSIHLQALENNGKLLKHLTLQGMANLNAQRPFHVELALISKAENRSGGSIHFILEEESGSKCAKIQCKKLSFEECVFIQDILVPYCPSFDALVLENGELSARIEAKISQTGIKKLFIEQLEAIHLHARFKTRKLTCLFDQIKGHGTINLEEEEPWKTLTMEMQLEGGTIVSEQIDCSIPITNIEAHLSIQQGRVEQSLVTLQVAGLKGKMDVKWGNEKQLLCFKLEGIVQDLAGLFPKSIQHALRSNFAENKLVVQANVHGLNEEVKLDGTLHIQRDNEKEKVDLIHFGYDLKEKREEGEIKQQLAGWFHAQKLPLEKFLSPFIFRNGLLRLVGEGEFQGSFDERFLLVQYDASDLVIESDDMRIEIPQMQSSIPGKFVGSHRIDLKSFIYQGTLPIHSASYLLKKNGLDFRDIQGIVHFTNDLVHVCSLEMECEDIHFAGELMLDYKDPAPGVFDLMVYSPQFFGKVSQVQHLLSRLDNPSLLDKIPLEGDVCAREEGLQMSFSFRPEDCRIEASLKGMITDGELFLEDTDISVCGIDLDVDYLHSPQSLKLSEIQGTLLVGKPKKAEEYFIGGQYIHFYRLNQPDFEVDIAIKDQDYELMRIAGKVRNEGGEKQKIELNQDLSHFSCIYPYHWQCRLRNWTNIEQFECRAQFELSHLLKNLGRFRLTGLPFLSQGLIDEMTNNSPMQGKGSLFLHYHPDQRLVFHLEGSEIKQENGAHSHFAFLKGSKSEKKWVIDQLQWDDLNIYAEVHPFDEQWKIPFLGLKIGQSILLGLDGDWFKNEGCFKAKLKYCQMDLSRLQRFEMLQPFVAKWQPKGILNAVGEVEWNLFARDPLAAIKANLTAEVSHSSVRDFPFQISAPFKISLQPNQALSIHNVQLEFAAQKRQSYIDFRKIEYHFQLNTLKHLQAVFQIPQQQLEVVGNAVHHYFPEILEESTKEYLVGLKQKGQLKGNLLYESHIQGAETLNLNLENDFYSFKNQEYDLKNLVIQIKETFLHFSCSSQLENCPLQIKGRMNWPACDGGYCQILGAETDQPLTMRWKNQAAKGWAIQSLVGEFCGCSFNLKENRGSEDQGDWIPMQGSVAIDFERIFPLLKPHIVENIKQLKIASVFRFTGHLWVNSNFGATVFDNFSFKGKVESDKLVLKGIQFRYLQSDFQYVPGRFDIQNALIDDPAGTFQCPQCVVDYNSQKEGWTFAFPNLFVRNLNVSQLKEVNPDLLNKNKFRTLILKNIDFKGFAGSLDDSKTWRGQGSASFTNIPRKNIFAPLFAIPSEIILRVGLDPHVLNPVVGTIDFEVKDNRFYLTQLKDVYSDGRGSKFYLSQSSDPSWMDFNGNLFVNIRMKQYNILFKIAELFTFSMQGNIQKPYYTIQKASKKGNNTK